MEEPLTLLVVDDDRGLLGQLKLRYRDFFNVLTASSVQEAQHIVSSNRIPLFLVDVRLSDSDDHNSRGLELVKELRRKLPGATIIMMSRYNEEQYRRLALGAGADDFIRKPFTVDQFVELVGRCMEQSHAGTTAD